MLADERKLANGIPEQALQKVGPIVWDSGVPRKAKTTQPVQIHLKPGMAYPHSKQCPIKQEALEGLQPITEKFVTQGCWCPVNPPAILQFSSVLKLTRKYILVQDLKLVNKAIVALHPLVDNTYTILTQVPDYTQWYTVLD